LHYSGPVVFNYTATDGTLSSSSTASLTLGHVNQAPAIDQGPQTASVADGGVVYASGHLTATDPDTGDTLTWTVNGGTRLVSENYQYGIDEFSVSKVITSGTITQIFDDTFTGTAPPAGPNFPGGMTNGAVYADFGGTYVPGTNAALLEGSNATAVGLSLNPATYDATVFGQFTTLLTGTSFNSAPGIGLRSGQSFAVNGLFDLTTPNDSKTHYGIRLSDRVIGSTGGAFDQPGTETVDLAVVRNADGSASVLLDEINFETGIVTNLATVAVAPQAGDNEIRLTLSNSASNNGQVHASFTLERNVGGVEVADGSAVSITSAAGHIFSNQDWTRSQFYGQSVATPSSSPQADSILQGTYGSLDIAQNGTWQYFLNPGLASVKALAANQTVQDIFHVTAADSGNLHSTQTITVNVTGINDAAVITGTDTQNLTETDAVLTTSGVLSVTDVDSAATFGPQTNVEGSGGFGKFSITAAGAWTYTADTAHDEFVGGTTYTDTLTVSSADGTTHLLTVNILGTNDAPVFTGHDRQATFLSGGSAAALADNVLAGDIDSADYAGGSLTATVTAGFQVGDTLSIAESQYIHVSTGNVVSFDSDGEGPGGAVDIGTLSGSGTSLTVTLNASADNAAIAALTDAIRFETSDPTQVDRTVTFTLNDGDGTANGGHDFTRFDATVQVIPVGTPPPNDWIGPPGGDWIDPNNWTVEVPAPGDQANIGDGAIPTIYSNVEIDNVIVTMAATATIEITASTGSILYLDDDATIIGGAISIGAPGENGGSIQVQSSATLDGVSVIGNNGAVDVGQYASGVILTLDDDTSIIGGSLTIGANNILDIEIGTNGSGATLDGVAVSNDGAINVDPTGSGAILALDDDTTIIGGTLTIGGIGSLDLDTSNLSGGHGAALDGVVVTNYGAINVDPTGSGATPTFDDGTTIIGGTLTIDRSGTLDIEAGTNNGLGATLDGVTVNNYGAIKVDPAALQTILTLDDDTGITGGTLTIGAYGSLDIDTGNLGSGHGATLDGVAVTNDSAINVDPTASGAILTLDDDTTISHGSLTIGAYGSIDIDTGNLGSDHGATLEGVAITNNGAINVDTTDLGAILTLDDDTTITGGTLTIGTYGTVDIEAGANGHGATLDGVIVNSYGSTIEIGESSAATLLLDDGTIVYGGNLTIGNFDGLDIEAGPNTPYGSTSPDATLDGVTVYNSYLGMEIGVAGTATLLLDDNTTVHGGAMTIGNYGTLDVEVAGLVSSNPDATLDGVTVYNNSYNFGNSGIGVGESTAATLLLDDGTTISNGLLKVGAGSTLDIEAGPGNGLGATLDNVSVRNSGTVQIDISGLASTLTLDGGTSIFGGVLAIGGTGELAIEGFNFGFGSNATLDGVTVTDGGNINVDSTGSGAILTLDDGTIISGVSGGTLTIGNYGTLDIGFGVYDYYSNTYGSGATLDCVTVNNYGTLRIESGAILMLADEVDLQGGGRVIMAVGSQIFDDSQISSGSIVFLDNVDNTISGAGTIGDGRNLALTNEAGGTIVAINGVLTINTGTAIANSGLLAASAGSTLVVSDDVTGTGSAIIADGGILEFDSSVSSGQTVTFAKAGILSLLQPSSFAGRIAGFSRNDVLDLAGFNEANTTVTASAFDGTTTTLTVNDNGPGGPHASITLVGDHHADRFGELSDGHGGAYIVPNSGAATTAPVITGVKAQTGGPGGTLNFGPSAGTVYELEGATVSGNFGDGLLIHTVDANSSDNIIAEIDALSSIAVTGTSSQAVRVTTTGASIQIFNAAAHLGPPAAPSASIAASGSSGIGIFAQTTAGNGTVNVDDLPNTFVFGANIGIEAIANNNNVAVNVFASAQIQSTSNYGILALDRGVGNITVTTAFGDVITSGGAGIDATNQAASIAASANSTIQVTALGTINSGTTKTGAGNPPAGIIAGYFGNSTNTTPTSYLSALNGTVLVNNYADVVATAGDGIRAYNYGIGDVTVNDIAGAIRTLGGAISPAPPVGQNPPNGYGNGIGAFNYGPGNVVVTTAAGTSINSASSGISANNADATAPSTSSVSVVAHGTIFSGSIPSGSGSPAAGILAGYFVDGLADPNVHGNVVIDDYGSIFAAAGTDGIRGYNYGDGHVAITVEAGATIDGPRYGVGAFSRGGGDASITNYGSVTGGTDAINATGNGTATISNYGQLYGDVAAYDATFTNYDFWSMDGTSAFIGASTLANYGSIYSNGTSEISGLTSFTNAGVIEVQSGTLKIDTAMTGGGTAYIAGGTLEFGAASDANVYFLTSYQLSNTFVLDDAAHFTGTIFDITAFGDTIDLAGIAPANIALNYNLISRALELHYDSAHPSQFISITGGIVASAGSSAPSYFVEHSDGHGGTDVVYDPPPVINTNQFVLLPNGNDMTIAGLSVFDASATPTETFNINATTTGAGSSMTPSAGSGLLTEINTTLTNGLTYHPGTPMPSTDKVTLTVTDGLGATDTVNFIFNEAGTGPGITLQGTAGKDVIFATGNTDTVTGAGGHDQFVFKPTSSPTPVQHTVNDFVSGQDTIDVRLFNNISAATLPTGIQQGNDTLVTLDAHDTLLLKGVIATHLHASDFLFHA
jgi:VCBS repeat-containing protein